MTVQIEAPFKSLILDKRGIRTSLDNACFYGQENLGFKLFRIQILQHSNRILFARESEMATN
jgi:hypothetical protein